MSELTPREAAYQYLRENLEIFSARAMKVLPKEGGKPTPFIFNRAQKYIHERLEQQLAEIGYVRALILKGRQQGCCLDPDTPVLKADLTWARIGDLLPGDELVAVDEETSSRSPGDKGGGRGRRMATATVEVAVRTRQISYRIRLDDGRTLITSGRHRWLTRKSQTQWKWRSVEDDSGDGRSAIMVGDKLRSVTGVDGSWTLPSSRQQWEGKSMPDRGERTIVEITPLGERDVVDIQTSTGTFIANGIVSHNSTYVAARYYHKCSMNMGERAFIVSHEEKSTTNLFGMVKRYHSHNPFAPSTKASNAQELIFGQLDGGYKLATAGSDDVGRGNTARLLHGCLSPDTLVISATGALRRMDEFEVGDLVRTHTGKAASISVISRQTKRARKVWMRTFGLPFAATDEHRFWTPDGWKELGQLAVGSEVGFPIQAIGNRVVRKSFGLPAVDRPQGGGSTEDVPATVELTYNLGRILGLYLAEGTVSCQKTGTPSAVMFSIHEREVNRTVLWLTTVSSLFASVKVRYIKGSKTAIVTAYGKSFAAFVSEMCGRVDDRRVPAEWVTAGDDFARGLVHGYLCGDGHFSPARDRRISATSVRSAITIGMRDMLASLGYGWASIEHNPAAVRHGRNEREAFVLRMTGPGVVRLSDEVGKPSMPYERAPGGGNFGSRIADGYAWLKVARIDEPVDQEVMDFEVDHEDHSYCLPGGASHNSEFGFWRNAQAHLAGLGNTIPSGEAAAGSEIILESTANGIGNAFHTMWQAAEAGEGEYIAIFVPWYWQEEYRSPPRAGFESSLSQADLKYQAAYGLDLAQMQWRANKIAEYGKGFAWLFDQEYPATAALAFQTSTQNPLVSPHDVMAAVNSTYMDTFGPVVLGCDPAGEGEDRTAIVWRQGRVVWRCEYLNKLNTMQVAGMLAKYWREGAPADAGPFKGRLPDGMLVDRIGIGAGVVDRLRELNIPVIGVHSGERADEPDLYENKRAEMWWTMKEWFEDQPTRMVNDAALISDITAPQPKLTSKSKKLLESKADMKKRGIRSPDGGDALALTFAAPVSPRAQEDALGGTGYRRSGKKPASHVGY